MRKKFEYTYDFREDLNKLGQDGWEAVCPWGEYKMIFKREIIEPVTEQETLSEQIEDDYLLIRKVAKYNDSYTLICNGTLEFCKNVNEKLDSKQGYAHSIIAKQIKL